MPVSQVLSGVGAVGPCCLYLHPIWSVVTAEFALIRCANLYHRENIMQLIDNAYVETRRRLLLSRMQHSASVTWPRAGVLDVTAADQPNGPFTLLELIETDSVHTVHVCPHHFTPRLMWTALNSREKMRRFTVGCWKRAQFHGKFAEGIWKIHGNLTGPIGPYSTLLYNR